MPVTRSAHRATTDNNKNKKKRLCRLNNKIENGCHRKSGYHHSKDRSVQRPIGDLLALINEANTISFDLRPELTLLQHLLNHV